MNPIVDIYALLAQLEPNAVANVTITLMVIIFGIAILSILKRRHAGFQHYAPGLLTTLGILGTFLGISIGLVNFDVEQIDASIPHLLEGLKMAFITSIAGMGLSIVTKTFETWRANGDARTVADVGPEQIYSVLQQQNEALAGLKAEMEQTRKAISGDEDASLVTQLQKLRTDLKDGNGEIRNALTAESDASVGLQLQRIRVDLQRMEVKVAEEFRNFATKVSEIGSKQLIQALQEVIKDFNKNLTEQFGQNFQRLDDSVAKLVQWQDNYKHQMEDMDRQFQQTVTGLQTSQQTLGKISEHSAAIPQHMSALETVIRTSEAQLADLDRHLKAFADVQEKAANAMPLIKEQLDQTMDTVKASVKRASDHYQIMLDDAAGLIKNFRESTGELHEKFVTSTEKAINRASEEMSKTTQTMVDGGQKITDKTAEGARYIEDGTRAIQAMIDKAIDGMDKAIREAGNNLTNVAAGAFKEQKQQIQELSSSLKEDISHATRTHQELLTGQNQQMQQLFAGLKQGMTEATSQHNQLIKAELSKIDETMQKEIERVMQVMGNQLVSITGQFVKDYRVLTDGMSQVVQQYRKVS